jgi:hypothetical protein
MKDIELWAETVEDLLEEQVSILHSMTDVVAEAIESSPFVIEPEKYFIWMYSVEPFAEA